MEFKEFAKEVCRKIRNDIYHGEYSMQFDWPQSQPNDDQERGIITNAEIIVDSKYLNCTIKLFPNLKKWYDEGYINRVLDVLMHEMCHILTQPMLEEATRDASPSQKARIGEINERQTQRISNALYLNKPTEYWLPKGFKKQKAKHQKKQSTKPKYEKSSKKVQPKARKRGGNGKR
jgi:hypothetical protein